MSDVSQNLSDLIGVPPKSAVDSDADSDDLSLQQQRLAVARYSSDTADRKWLAYWTVGIVSLWLVAVLVILVLNQTNFCLDNSVLITLLGTTTLNVLGLSFIVLRGHFRPGSK